MNRKLSISQSLLLILLAICASASITYYVTISATNVKLDNIYKDQQELKKFIEIKDFVQNHFIGEFDSEKSLDYAMDGYIQGLGDKWSYYLTKEQYSNLEQMRTGEFTGIGITVDYDSETKIIQILEVYDNSPAQKAGIAALDILISVDDVLVSELGYEGTVAKCKGEEGTSIKLTLQRNDVNTDYVMTREAIKQKSIESVMLKNNIGYVRIKEFIDTTGVDFINTLNDLKASGAKAFVFDVRNNPGGMKNILIDMLDHLMPPCDLFVTEQKNGKKIIDRTETPGIDLPYVILVNERSISAAEYFAAVNQEYQRAKIVGENTTGKGYAQRTIPLEDGSAINISTSKYYLPSGKSLVDSHGVVPDYIVPLADELKGKIGKMTLDEDAQLKKAYDLMVDALN